MATPTAPIESRSDAQEESVVFRGQALEQVKALADAQGLSFQEFVRNAISSSLWMDEVLADDGEIIAKRKHGQSEVLRRKR